MIPKQIDKKIIGLPDAGEKLIDTVNDLISYLQEREGEKCICPSPDEFYLKRCPVHSMSTSPQQTDEWEEEFDKELSGMNMCCDCKEDRERYKSFIRTHFIEKKKVREAIIVGMEDERPEIRQWLRSKEYTKGYNQSRKDLLSSLQLTEDEEVI